MKTRNKVKKFGTTASKRRPIWFHSAASQWPSQILNSTKSTFLPCQAIRFLTLSGELMHPSTRVTIFVLNDRFYKGEVTFKDFVSQSDIQLINIQDARSVRVTDSAFAEVREIDILRTDFCYADNTVVDCDDINQLFPTSWCKWEPPNF